MGSKIREVLLSAEARTPPKNKVRLPAPFDIDVYVRGLTAHQRGAFEASLRKRDGTRSGVNVYAKLLVMCIVEEDGTRVFHDHEVEALAQLRGDLVTPLYELAQQLSGYSEKDMEDLGKASEPAPSPVSSSGSRSASEA